ncbi:MAG: CpaF family protein [Actinomycetes bacterium]
MNAITHTASEPTNRRIQDALATRIGEALADERLDRQNRGESYFNSNSEMDFARQVSAMECARLSASRRQEGLPALTDIEEQLLTSRAIDQVLGMGLLQQTLDDPEVSDIHVRGNSPIWVKLRSGTRECRSSIVDRDDELIDLIRRTAVRMGRSERRFDAGSPELNLQLPDGSRLFATMDISSRPSLVIRKHQFEISSLEDLETRGMMSHGITELFRAMVRSRRNVIIAGGTGSGKTTLMRALINEVPPEERIVTIEDAYELGLERFEHLHPDHDSLQSRPANIEGQGEITLADLTKMALRMDPDRVIVGEVRGAEAFPMLMAMSQGNNGSMCTLHADSTRSVFPKLAAYMSMSSTSLPIETTNLLIASSVHFVVHIAVVRGQRRVSSIREVVDSDGLTIMSNEVVRNINGTIGIGYPLREDTRELLEEFGFREEMLR